METNNIMENIWKDKQLQIAKFTYKCVDIHSCPLWKDKTIENISKAQTFGITDIQSKARVAMTGYNLDMLPAFDPDNIITKAMWTGFEGRLLEATSMFPMKKLRNEMMAKDILKPFTKAQIKILNGMCDNSKDI